MARSPGPDHCISRMAMITRRHQIEYGTTEDHFAEVAVAFRNHAIRNPAAVMRKPMTIQDHHESRLISDPLRLYDCNIETDGACAMIVTSVERARDLKQKQSSSEPALSRRAPTTGVCRASSSASARRTRPSGPGASSSRTRASPLRTSTAPSSTTSLLHSSSSPSRTTDSVGAVKGALSWKAAGSPGPRGG